MVWHTNDFSDLVPGTRNAGLGYVIIFFYKGRPCQQIKPYFAELSSRFPQFQFLKVDVDEHSELAYWANVRAMPQFTIYKDGFKVNESLGANLNKIVEMVRVLN